MFSLVFSYRKKIHELQKWFPVRTLAASFGPDRTNWLASFGYWHPVKPSKRAEYTSVKSHLKVSKPQKKLLLPALSHWANLQAMQKIMRLRTEAALQLELNTARARKQPELPPPSRDHTTTYRLGSDINSFNAQMKLADINLLSSERKGKGEDI